jgi:autotransporter-associated beta strand protein
MVTGSNWLGNGTASQVNGGLMIITNGALVSMTTSEFWVAQNANNTATVIVDGGTLVTSNNWLVVGRNANTANGTLIVNHGTVIKAGANNIVVGSLGATGDLVVNGGQVLNNGMLWLGENATANAYLHLNGGLVQATQIRYNGAAPTNSIAYCNGGTIQATGGSTNFFGLGTLVYIQSGGLVFDDGGFAITNATQIWLDDGGGQVVKQGAGTLYMDTANTYSGSTLVSSGTLAGNGSFIGPVSVGPSGNLGAGDAGTNVGVLTVNNTLTLQGNVTLRVGKTASVLTSDSINASAVNYGRTLTVNNIGSDALAPGDSFNIFSTGTPVGNFTIVLGSPGFGLGYQFNPATGVLSVITGGPPTTPTKVTFSVSGSTFNISWPAAYKGWILQSQTNSASVGLRNVWYDIAGTEAITSTNMTINPANRTVFYRLRYP